MQCFQLERERFKTASTKFQHAPQRGGKQSCVVSSNGCAHASFLGKQSVMRAELLRLCLLTTINLYWGVAAIKKGLHPQKHRYVCWEGVTSSDSCDGPQQWGSTTQKFWIVQGVRDHESRKGLEPVQYMTLGKLCIFKTGKVLWAR